MLDDCENHSASCCEIRLEPSPILTKVSAAGVGTTPGEGPETQRTHCRPGEGASRRPEEDRKSTRLNSSHSQISYAVFCLKKKTDACRAIFSNAPCEAYCRSRVA